MRLKYNAPTVLTFAFTSAAVLVLSITVFPDLSLNWFRVAGKGNFNPGSAQSWITLCTHVIGHSNWNHLISNFAYILLIGPILE